jgi:multiple sugar transport system substrate-binding protein
MLEKKKLSRRDFLHISMGATASGLLTACGVKATSEKEEEVVIETGGEEVEAPIAEPEELTVMFWDGPPLIGIREEALDPFDEVNTQCKLNFLGVSDGYNDKLLTMIAGGAPPDLFIIRIDELPTYLKKDLLLDLKPFIERDNYDISQFPDLAIQTYTYEGGIYGMPDNVASMAIFYNVEMFDEEGLVYPTAQWDDDTWTIDAFMDTCEKLTKRDANGKVTQYAYYYNTWGEMPWIWVRIFGGQLVDNPFEPTEITLTTPEAVEGLQFLQDLVYKYEYMPTPDVTGQMGVNDLLLTKRLAMVENGSWFFPVIRDADFEIDVGHYPKGPGGRHNYVYYFPLVIPKASKSPDCAWELLKYFNGPAMEMIIRDGGLQGTTFAAQEKWFLTDPLPPKNKQVFTDSVKHFVAPDPVLTNWLEIKNIIDAEMDYLWTNQKPAKEVAESIKQQVDPMIAEGRIS